MSNSLSQSPIDYYRQYVRQNCPELDLDLLSPVTAATQDTNWDEPESAFDLNNFAVMALIETEEAEDKDLRQFNLEMAIEALSRGGRVGGVELGGYPLCAAHLALVKAMLGEREGAMEIALSHFLGTLQPAYESNYPIPLGLVYLPQGAGKKEIEQLLQAENGYSQALFLLALVLYRAQMVFYSATGLRFLQLVARFVPVSPTINLQLGLSSLMNGQMEGLLSLHEGRKLTPHNGTIIHALYLAYRTWEQKALAQFWYDTGREVAAQATHGLNWGWTKLPRESPFTYLSFEGLLLATEPSLRSIVTSVLLAESDWFEAEMEFWRSQLQPGMTVIDVGANVGVYTFSAAQRVGKTGKVLAVEPFSGCVSCLQETCSVNQLSWVRIFPGAASDYIGTARLALHSANELNEVISEDSTLSGNWEEITCFTLDSLIQQENMSRVDWLKIDAEGHEMEVLKGSKRLLSEFTPGILYENIAGYKGSNLPVAEFLQSQGYQLYYYQPYVQQLIPVDSLESSQSQLNIIALPSKNR